MATTRFRFPAATLTAAAVLACAASHAMALDAYWHGVRSNKWHQGSNGEQSNWYDMAPQGGSPVNVPDGTAKFAPGAKRKNVNVTGTQAIGAILYPGGKDAYKIKVEPSSSLRVNGAGITNASGVKQSYVVDGDGAVLEFRNKAKACVKPGASVYMDNLNHGRTVFKGHAKGGKKCRVRTYNRSQLKFVGNSSAGKLYILNKGPKGKVEFQDKSSAGRADIDNLDGLVRFETRGPKNDYSNTAKAIDNFSSLNLGPTKLAVSRRVILESSSVFSISFDENGQPGSIHANSSIAVDGEIIVRGDSSVKAGTYLILKSNKRVFGTFKKIHDPGFSNGLKAKLVYGAGDVHLIVGK